MCCGFKKEKKNAGCVSEGISSKWKGFSASWVSRWVSLYRELVSPSLAFCNSLGFITAGKEQIKSIKIGSGAFCFVCANMHVCMCVLSGNESRN